VTTPEFASKSSLALLAIYSRSEASDLTAEQKGKVASIVAAIEKEDLR